MKIAIYGYGNLGRGVECAAYQNPDTTLVGIFTRRPPSTLKSPFNTPIYPSGKVLDLKGEIDVLIIAGGSATDLPTMTPTLARHFNVVDSFDTHSSISAHLAAVDAAAREGGNLAVISAGWDPGLFSVARTIFSSIFPDGMTHTFWGRGVSQGHSDAIRHIDGVLDARQYTVPISDALAAARRGECRTLSPFEMHRRECYVVIADNADPERIERSIKTMPDYFRGYDTAVTFLSASDLEREHSKLPHAGSVITTAKTGASRESNHTLELSLKLDSNPEFTGAVLVSVARAANIMAKNGKKGCKTLLDIPPAFYSPQSREELIHSLL